MNGDLRMRRGIVGLLLALILVGLAAEGFARWGVPRISKIEARVSGELQQARRIGADAEAARSLLIVGNSLLESGVEPSLLAAALAPGGWQAQRLAIEGTDYLDWYHGLQAYFEQGHRPGVVVLMLSAKQVMSMNTRGGYLAHHLLGLLEAVRLAQAAGMHPTQQAGMALAAVSSYYGLRVEIRQVFLQRLVPGVQQVADVVADQVRQQRRTHEQVPDEAAMSRRLTEFSALCERYRSRCLLSVATEPRPSSWAPRLIDLAQRQGLATADLQPALSYDLADYQADQYHMSPVGARKFSGDLGARLSAVLSTRP